jgi:hypothetical protein
MRYTKEIPTKKLYHIYKPHLKAIYEKYHRHDGNPMLWKNTPLTIFSSEYLRLGKNILKVLDEQPFIRCEYERYFNNENVKNDTHKYIAAQRVMDIVDSIQEHGYLLGKYKKRKGSFKYKIRVRKGFVSPYGSDPNGYSLVSRKHRAAACVALGMKKVKVLVCG